MEGDLDVACSDIWGNAGGDWVGEIAGHLGVDGNFTADPGYCDTSHDDLTLIDTSPCLPGQHPEGYDCGLIGAFGEGCGTTPTEVRTWGEVKSLFR